MNYDSKYPIHCHRSQSQRQPLPTADGRRPTASHFAPLLCCGPAKVRAFRQSAGARRLKSHLPRLEALSSSLRSGGVHFLQLCGSGRLEPSINPHPGHPSPTTQLNKGARRPLLPSSRCARLTRFAFRSSRGAAVRREGRELRQDVHRELPRREPPRAVRPDGDRVGVPVRHDGAGARGQGRRLPLGRPPQVRQVQLPDQHRRPQARVRTDAAALATLCGPLSLPPSLQRSIKSSVETNRSAFPLKPQWNPYCFA
jgi:hypothetical protein